MINFKMSELIYSEIANKNNISNVPDINSLDNLLNLIVYCLQPIRNLINKPMIITSGFRSKKLNQFVGGIYNSQHLLGCAADFKVLNMSTKDVVKIILNSNIEFDQLINEYDSWVHISFLKNKNRKQFLHKK
ncbi:MAG: hypothetical protein IKU37_09240 [Candidatus Gastranaerophilales bacterium]|nr:hypothetical protein [Candidatus Gastranaerophilales bacterium]